MSDAIVVEGIEETVANLYRFADVLQEELVIAVAKCVDLVVNDARQTDAFHDHTGDLRNSIDGDQVEDIIAGIAGGVIEGRAWAGMEYGKWVELGTSKMMPHAFLEPALQKNWDNIMAELVAAVERAKARCAVA